MTQTIRQTLAVMYSSLLVIFRHAKELRKASRSLINEDSKRPYPILGSTSSLEPSPLNCVVHKSGLSGFYCHLMATVVTMNQATVASRFVMYVFHTSRLYYFQYMSSQQAVHKSVMKLVMQLTSPSRALQRLQQEHRVNGCIKITTVNLSQVSQFNIRFS